jgi:hypothetical protein
LHFEKGWFRIISWVVMARRKIMVKYIIGLTYGIEINNFENVVVLFYTDFDAMSCAGSNEIVANEVEKNQRIYCG